MIERQRSVDVVGGFRMIVGAILVIVGTILLLMLGFALITVINEPKEMALFELLYEETANEGSALAGHLAELQFDIKIGEPLRSLLFVVLIVWVLSAIVGMIRGLVSSGLELLRGKKD